MKFWIAKIKLNFILKIETKYVKVHRIWKIDFLLNGKFQKIPKFEGDIECKKLMLIENII